MDALIALNRRELALQAELEEIRTQKAALLATLAKPAAALLTPTKVKATIAAPPPPAPKKAASASAPVSDSEGPSVARKITIRRKSEGSASTTSTTSVPPSADSAVKHWKAFKKAKADQIAAAQPGWGKARVKTAIRNAYTLEHPAQAATLDQLEKVKQDTKVPRAPSEWLQYVATVKAELGCSHHDAMVEAGRRRRAAAEGSA
jgi:hypothetical protein